MWREEKEEREEGGREEREEKARPSQAIEPEARTKTSRIFSLNKIVKEFVVA